MSDLDGYFTANDLAHVLHVSVAEIYRRASRNQWRRINTRPVQYHLGDALGRPLDKDRVQPRDYSRNVGAVRQAQAHLAGSGYATLMASVLTGISPAEAQRVRTTEISTALRAIGPVVYAVLTDDSLIKFGYSTNLASRLRAYGIGLRNMRRLLMARPGSLIDEQVVLGRFAIFLVRGREYFHPAPVVIEYINEERERAGIGPLRFGSDGG